MINNTNEVTNFDQLMEKYLKDKNQILSKYDYKTPLKEISPMEPLIFQNDYTPTNNINSNKLQNYESLYNNNNNFEPINNNIKKYPYMENGYELNENENKFITPIKPITQKNSNSYINSSIEREKALKEENQKNRSKKINNKFKKSSTAHNPRNSSRKSQYINNNINNNIYLNLFNKFNSNIKTSSLKQIIINYIGKLGIIYHKKQNRHNFPFFQEINKNRNLYNYYSI